MTTITQLEYIIAVDQEKHFGRAAKTCFVSQPSLSAQIQKVEDELEVIIFDRSKQPILTTEIGKEIVEQAKVVISEHRKLKIIADETSLEPKGFFNLAVIPTLASYVIPLFVGHFSQTYPLVNLGINEYKTEDIIKLLLNDEIDAGLMVTPLEDDRLIERPLFYEPFHCYLNESHPLSRKKQLSTEDLDASDLWLLTEGHCFRDQMLRICSADKSNNALPTVRFESGNLETLIKLVKANSGFTLLPQLAVDGLSQSELNKHVRSFQNPVPTREVSLVYNRRFLKETIIKALETSILKQLPDSITALKKNQIEVVDI